MNITPKFIIICERAFLTAGSNNLNLIGIFSQINADKFPCTYPAFALVVNFDAAQPGQHVLRTDITDPTGKQVAHTELPVAVTAGNMQVIANFEHMQFAVPGAYTLAVSLDGHPFGSRAITVRPAIPGRMQKANLA